MSVPLTLAGSRWSREVMDIPIHLLSPLIPFLLPWSPSALLFRWSALRSHSQSSQQANICLEMCPLLFCFFGSETLRHVGGKEEIPRLREASPPLGRQQAEKQKACAGVWMRQLFPHHTALVSSHIYLVFFAMCLSSNLSRKSLNQS